MKTKRLFIQMATWSLLIMMLSSCSKEVVTQQPAPPVAEVAPASPPYPDGVWINTEWRWDPVARVYVRVPGYWARPPHPAHVWVPGHWATRRGGYGWVPGHWVAR